MKSLLIIGCVLGVASGFSLDNHDPIVLVPPIQYRNNSLFGYSLAAHGKDVLTQRLLVGAPRAVSPDNSTVYPGALFACDIGASPHLCEKINLDGGRVDFPTQAMKIQETHNQRLGASLATDGDSTLVCAPNWFYVYLKSRVLNSAPVGKCYHIADKNFKTIIEFSPVLTKARKTALSYTNSGYCQGGTSVAFDGSKSKEAIVGAPGCTAWIGDVYIGKPGGKSYRTRGSDYTYNDFFENKSKKRKVDVNERYFGYTIANGKFNNKVAVVASAPRASTLNDFEVVKSELNDPIGSSVSILLKKNETAMRTWKNFHYPQAEDWLFAYCGYSLAVGDVNGDGLDDIVTGCPYYGIDTSRDSGAILIFYQTQNGKVYDVVMEDMNNLRNGEKKGDMFGTSVAIIEDIDGDGYKEVAVGAPFAYEGVGNVYIYCGTNGALPTKPCQELKPHEPTERGLGWSIASVANSLAVSAPQSEYVFVYSKFAVMSINLTGEVGEFDISKPCKLDAFESHPAAKLPCASFKLCVQYSLRNKITSNFEREIQVKVVLDRQSERSRLIFFDHTRETDIVLIAEPDEKKCETLIVYDRHETEQIVEYLVGAEASYKPVDVTEEKVVLDERDGLIYEDLMRMKIECEGGETTTCRTDVKMEMIQIGNYVYGKSDSVTIKVTIEVRDEPSYYPKLLLHTHGNLQKSGDAAVMGAEEVCHEYEEAISCSMGGVKDAGDVISYTFKLTPSADFIDDIEKAEPKFLIEAEFTTMSTIVNEESAKATLNVDIGIDPKLDLSKISSPDSVNLVDISLPETTSKIESLGPKIIHEYTVDNNNKYPVYGIELKVKWPYKHHSNGGYLLYIGERPKIIVTGNQYSEGICVEESGGVFDEMQLIDAFQPSNRLPPRRRTSKRGAEKGAALSEEPLAPSPVDSFLIFTCTLHQIPSMEAAKVSIVAYAVKETFLLVRTELPYIESSAEATVDHIPFGQKYTEKLTATIANNVIYPSHKTVQEYWYWVLLAVILGLVIVFIIGYFIYKAMVKKNKKDQLKATDGVGGKEEMEKLNPETEETPVFDEIPMRHSQV